MLYNILDQIIADRPYIVKHQLNNYYNKKCGDCYINYKNIKTHKNINIVLWNHPDEDYYAIFSMCSVHIEIASKNNNHKLIIHTLSDQDVFYLSCKL